MVDGGGSMADGGGSRASMADDDDPESGESLDDDPTAKTTGNGQPPFRAAVNPEADQPDTPADPTPSRPPSPGYVG
ncbi:hypothetical protein [Oryza sativa Japonica Group]|uniref:Uncharacterized protein n=1 Tax=Oryza sativa subsp. japonica TaxID=39947 RepID=Q5SN42_ORYSJ|nr:hypothetical protein [Oryza sativa Japonica Group]